MFIEFVGMTLEDMQLIVKYEVCMCSQYSISIFFLCKGTCPSIHNHGSAKENNQILTSATISH